MDKEIAKEKIKELVGKFSSYSKSEVDSMPEEDIKFKFIEPLFEILGWKREDISKETRILKGRADYILKIGNQDKLVVEAKKTNVSLLEKEGRQAVSYAYHRKIKFSVLTNFKEIKVYHALSNIKNIDNNLLRKDNAYFILQVNEFVENFDLLWLLSKESFENEEINKLLSAKDERINKPIDESILADLLQYREWLSKDLKSKRNYLTDGQIDEAVQILIDRLIFMRSVEDRSLEAEDFLLKIIKEVEQGETDMNLWGVLKAQFKRFDSTYNSKLFADGFLDKEGFFENKILAKVIRGLYYGTSQQQERYMFDEIPVDLLGSIYEQYLGVVLRGTDKRVKLDLQSGKRKKMGIYYTPSYIVDYIVKNTIGEYCKDKSLDEVLKMRVVDPACGSGSFLIRAFQELISIVEDRLKRGERSKEYSLFQKWEGKLNLGEKKQILLSCIYGVDLDEKAIELARLNLLLKCLEEETRETKSKRLPNLSENIKNGNSLISDSRYDKAFNWNAQFPEVFAGGGFDIVVGNPPYGVDFKKKDKEYLRKNYKTSSRVLESYILFIEKSKELLKEKGVLGFIIPETWLTNPSNKNLRELLLKETSINQLVDIPGMVFKSATVDTIVILFTKEKKENEISVIFVEPVEDIRIKEIVKIPQEKYLELKDSCMNTNFNLETIKLIEKIDSGSVKLKQLCKNTRGIETGNNNKYLSDKKGDESYQPIIIGDDIKRYLPIGNKKFVKYGGWLSNPKNLEMFKGSKLVLQRIKNQNLKRRLVCSIDEEDRIILDSVHMIYDIDEKINPYYLLGLFNSRLLNFYFKLFSLYPRINADDLDNLPICLPSSKSQEEKIIRLVERMIELQKKIHSEGISGNEKTQLEQQAKNIDYEIDEEVYKLYEITEEEIKIIEGSLK